MSEVIYTRLEAIEFIKAYPRASIRNPEAYVLSAQPCNFKHYELFTSYYNPDDTSDYYSIEDATLEPDSFGFWAESDNPIRELANRIRDFEKICTTVIESVKQKYQSSGFTGMTLQALPKDKDSQFVLLFVEAWVLATHKPSIDIPNGFHEAVDHIDSLFYKWRKMVELYENICQPYLKEEIFKHCD